MFGRPVALSLRRTARRIAPDESGASAVEFALIAAPFFALLFAIIQTALVFFAGQVLETGVSDAARLIRTGQAQDQKMDAAKFKEAVCDEIVGMFDCLGGLKLDVRTYKNFSDANLGKPIKDGELVDDFVYEPGSGGDIVVVRAFYEWPTVFPTLGVTPADLKNGKYLLSAAATFRNEPF